MSLVKFTLSCIPQPLVSILAEFNLLRHSSIDWTGFAFVLVSAHLFNLIHSFQRFTNTELNKLILKKSIGASVSTQRGPAMRIMTPKFSQKAPD